MPDPSLTITDLGRLSYADAYQIQLTHVERVLAARAAGEPHAGTILLVEHDPVITMPDKPSVRGHLLASPELLARHGVSTAQTDRGGDITYHGPGQLVVYPILDLNLLNLGLHDYMALLEGSVIDTLAEWGVPAFTDPGARGVWVAADNRSGGAADWRSDEVVGKASGTGHPASAAPTRNAEYQMPNASTTALPLSHSTTPPLHHPTPSARGPRPRASKICATGVRVRRWVSMHGLAFNVDPNLAHFSLIVPCGLVGRPVTSLRERLGPAGPSMAEVKAVLTRALKTRIAAAAARADQLRNPVRS